MRQIRISITAIFLFTLLCGIIYPAAITAIARGAFPWLSQGSLITAIGKPAGSALIGQAFTKTGYFHGRPSATDPQYNARASAASNAGPTNARFLAQVRERAERLREEHGAAADSAIPADLVTASASGLDPHISLEAALFQVRRVARERKMDVAEIEAIIRQHAEGPFLGFWGKERVNVLLLNRGLDLYQGERHEKSG